MPGLELTVHHKAGLHARPAALFVQTAKQFPCDIRVRRGDREANAKSILSILTLGVTQGTVIAIRAEGDRAAEALATLEALVASNFGEEQ
jgi:phosphotransferase system HPr (HPr) family protein